MNRLTSNAMKAVLPILLGTAAAAVPAHAQLGGSIDVQVAVGADAQVQPDILARATAEELLAELKANQAEFKANPAKLNAAVERIVVPHFDMKYVSASVLARYYRPATPEQREAFQKAFTTQLVNFYGNALLQYSDETIEWQPTVVPEGATDVTVRSEVNTNGTKIPLNYMLHNREDQWRVYDVTVDGISLVTNYRGQFAAEIRRNGLDALIARLQAEQSALQ